MERKAVNRIWITALLGSALAVSGFPQTGAAPGVPEPPASFVSTPASAAAPGRGSPSPDPEGAVVHIGEEQPVYRYASPGQDDGEAGQAAAPEPGNEAGVPAVEPAEDPALAGIVIGEGKSDMDGDGMRETVRIQISGGREVTDANPGAYEGTFLYGTFEAVATAPDGQELHRFPLNEAFGGGEMRFRKGAPFRLLFDDYNEDGRSEFTVGQRQGSNGSVYSMLTLGPDGFRVLSKEMYSADQEASIRYRKRGTKAFVNIYYDQSKGSYMEVVHQWKDVAFVAEAPVEAKEVRPAGED
ncbi:MULTISPECIES: hypothetical protein [Paenibacillus]|uniref:hypothetical protein n=1 Tax=Paenibacillus TaxID=44249 RepID=UPI0022B8B2E6|nr:hypothetical protein [Paenibacillus caseinilyticus]MCZ8518478.1 hypothetical protein [Paenibacillus caseinilyticus]